MDGDRKYKQHGYLDSGSESVSHGNGKHTPASGLRLPQMVETVSAARCWNCSTALPAGADFSGACAKCGSALHCCKQCTYFETSTRYQCLKPVPVRVAHKDEANSCELFRPRVTVARDSGVHAPAVPAPPGSAPPVRTPVPPAAFDSLFKK